MSLLGSTRLSNKKILFLISLMLLATVFSAPVMIPRAHALTGTVCIADPSLALSFTQCPTSPPVLSGPVGQLIRIGVFISGSDPYNAFDITLFADHTSLKPNDADLTRTTLNTASGPAVTVLDCIGGRLIHGTTCSSTDTVDTIHLAAVTAVGASTVSTSGLLFTAIYNITGTTSAGGIPVKFQSGCPQTSSAGNCVSVAGGGPPIAENIQAASFTNSASATMADVVLSASSATFGPEPPGTANSATITAMAKNGYPGSATDAVNFTYAVTSNPAGTPSISLSVATCSTAGTSCSVSVNLSSNNAGTFVITIYGAYATKDASGNPDTIVGYVGLTLIVNDFGFSVTPATINFDQGTTGTANVTLTSLGGFVGNITLAAPVIIGPGGLTVSFSLATVPLTSGATITSTAIFSDSTTTGSFRVRITATFQSRVKSTFPLLFVNVKAGPDYALIATPASVAPIVVGNAGTSTITVKPVAGFSGTVNLTNSTVSPGIACSLSPASIILGLQQNSTLTCTGSVAGVYLVQVTGTSGTNATLTHVVFVTFTFQDFALSASPASVAVLAGAQATSTITVSSLQGFTGVVALAVAVTPTAGLACSISPTSVAGFGSASLSCGGLVGTYTVKVTGTSGSIVHSLNVIYTVQDFSITASPSTIRFGGGSTGTSQIVIGPLNGFAGSVLLGAVSNSSSLTATLNSTTVTGGSGGATLTVSGSVIASFQVNVTGTSGSLSHSVIILVKVLAIPEFSLNAFPAIVSVQPGSIPNSTITVKSVNGFNGTITLTNTVTPTGLTCTLTPGIVKVNTTNTTSTSRLSCGGTPGVYTITVTGTNGTTLTHTVTVSVKIQDVTLTASSPSSVNAGQSASSTITVTSVGGLTGTVSLTDTLPSGLTCTAITPASVALASTAQTATVSCSSKNAGSLILSITGTMTSPALTRTATATFNFVNFTVTASSLSAVTPDAPATSTITITPQGGFSGVVSLVQSISTSNGLTCTLSATTVTGSGTATLSCQSSQTGTSTVTVTGTSGSLIHSVTVSVVVWDFSLTSSAPNNGIKIYVNSSSILTVSIVSSNGFNGPVSLTAGIVRGPGFTSGPVPTIGLSSSVLTVPADGSVSVNVNVTVGANVVSNIFAVQVNGTFGPRTQSVAVGITVPAPTISIVPSPTSLSTGPSVPGVSQITLKSVGGLHGVITLSLGVPSQSLSCSLGQSSMVLLVDGSATTGLVCTGAPGSYSVTITAKGVSPNGATISVPMIVSVSVVDFTVSSTPSGMTLNVSQVGHASITISWPNSYNGNVTFKLVPQSGLDATLRSATLTGPGSVTVDVSSAAPGVYTLIVNATSGSSSHNIALTITVIGVSSTSNLPADLIGVVAVVVVAGGAGGFLLLRRRKVPRK